MTCLPEYDFFSARQCNVCLVVNIKEVTIPEHLQTCNEDKQLRICNACHLIFYCGKEHQKLDWPVHRKFCKAVQKILNVYQIKHPFYMSYNCPPKDKIAMERTTLQVKFLLTTQLKRPLHFHEEELISFPVCCNVCYSFRGVSSCKICQGVSYCSKEHTQENLKAHNKVCLLLKLYYCVYKVLPMSADIIKELIGGPVNLQASDLFEAFQCATQQLLPKDPTGSLEEYQLFATASDFSCIATICYALSFVEMGTFENTKLIIFIVGATIEREVWFRKVHTQFFFLHYPQIHCLELFFIGPETVEIAEERVTYKFKDLQRTIWYKSKRMYFQEFHQVYNVKPSLIIAYNCGFSEFSSLDVSLPAKCGDNSASFDRINLMTKNADNGNDKDEDSAKSSDQDKEKDNKKLDTWPLGIQQMIHTCNLPIVFTSFTCMEAEFDYAAFLRVAMADRLSTQVERIFGVTRNPYRDMRPLRRLSLHDKEEIYYRNNYIQGVQCLLKNSNYC